QGMLEEMLPLLRRVAGVADFVEELRSAGVPLGELCASLTSFRQGAGALARGEVSEAAALLGEVARSRPELASAQAAGAAAAEVASTGAAGLGPDAAGGAAVSRRGTRRGGDTPAGSPTGPKARGPQVGDLLDGWQLVQLLGHGGWGTVFRAARDGEVAALKV